MRGDEDDVSVNEEMSDAVMVREAEDSEREREMSESKEMVGDNPEIFIFVSVKDPFVSSVNTDVELNDV